MKYLFSLLILLQFSSCYFTRAYKYRKYPLEKLNEFPVVKFNQSSQPFRFKQGSIDNSTRSSLDSMLIGSNRYAFLIIRNDSILYQFYNQNIADSTILPSFSVAKSYSSTLLGIALKESKIKSLDEPITNYLPELSKCDLRFNNITIQHVLDMRSGIQSSENYRNPFSDVLRLGFGKNVVKKSLNLKIESEPNKKFEYKSVNTQILSIIVERATGVKLQDYFVEKLQKPLQYEHPSTWIYDDEKHQELRAFCCMNLSAIDYAKFGRLYLNKGNWDGKQIIDAQWVENSTNLDTMKKYDGYKNQWWQDGKGFYARGLLHQYIYVNPNSNTVIVHFGNSLNPNKPLKPGFEKFINTHFK